MNIGHKSRIAFLVLFSLFILMLCLGGGSSRADVSALLFVRLMSLGVIGFMAWTLSADDLKPIKGALIFAACIAGLVLAQLIPLPPGLWAALPGHGPYVDAAVAMGVPQPWRPLSLTPDLTLNTLVSLLPPFAVLLFVGTSGKRVRRIAIICLLWIVIASVVLALLQQSGGTQSELRFYRFTNRNFGVGFLANRNHQALLMAMGIPLAAWWATQHGRIFENPVVRIPIAASVILLCFVGAALTASRTGIILTVVGLIGAIGIAWPLLRKLPSIAKAGIVAAVAVVGSIGLVAVFPRLQRFELQSIHSDLRMVIFPDLIEMVRDFFPIGAGFGSFERVYKGYERIETLSPQYVNRAHNDLLELGIEAGLAGYALLILFVLWWLLTSIRVWRTPVGKAPNLSTGRLGSILVGLGLIASLTDYPLRTPLLASVFAFASMLLFISGRSLRRGEAPASEGAGTRRMAETM